VKKLDPVSEPKSSTTTSAGSTTTLNDTLLAPAAESEDFVGDWIYIREAVSSGPAIGEITRVTDVDFAGTTSQLILAPAVTATIQSGTDYERHRKVRPNIINDRLDVILGLLRQNVTLPATILTNGDFEAATTSTDSGSNTAEALDATETEIDVDTSGANFDLGDVIQIDGEIMGPISAIDQSGTDIVVARGIMGTTATTHDTAADINILTPGDWTASGTGGTPALGIVDANVRHGRASLVITNDGSTTVGYAKSASKYLPGGTVCIVSADVFITAGDSAKLTFYDITNSAVIGTAMESDESGWVHLENNFTVPPTCEEVQVWLESQATSDITHWDHATLWPVLDKGVELPSFLEFLFDIESMFFYPVGTGIAGSTNVDAYRINEGAPQFYAHNQKELDDTGAGASRFYVPARIPTNALWIKGRKPYDAFSGSTEGIKDLDTTQANRYVVTNMTAASILDDLALDAIEAEKPILSQQLSLKAATLRLEIANILANMTPPKKKTITTPFTRE
jgi:hypothetical protein